MAPIVKFVSIFFPRGVWQKTILFHVFFSEPFPNKKSFLTQISFQSNHIPSNCSCQTFCKRLEPIRKTLDSLQLLTSEPYTLPSLCLQKNSPSNFQPAPSVRRGCWLGSWSRRSCSLHHCRPLSYGQVQALPLHKVN